MTRFRPSRSSLLALVAVVVLVAGCSDDKSGPTAKESSDTEASEARASAACRLVTRAEVQDALGIDLDGDGQSNQVGPASNCDWRAANQFVRLALVQGNSPGEAAQTFDVLDDRPGAQLVPNLGDKAVFLGSTPEANNAQLFILSGSRMVTVSYCCANEQQLVAIGRKALDRLD